MWKRLLALLILCHVAVMQPFLAFAQQNQQAPIPQQPPWYWLGPMHMWSVGYGYDWAYYWIFPMMMLIMLLVCGAVFFLFRQSSRDGLHHGATPWHMMSRSWSDPTHSALQILSERFARGEIQKNEFEDMKATILSNGHH